MTYLIDISKKLSSILGGRAAGNQFLNQVILPAFKTYSKIIFDFTNVRLAPTTFLDEAFGSLATYYSPSELCSKIEIRSKDEDIPITIWNRIEKKHLEIQK